MINSGIGDSDALPAIIIDDFNDRDFDAAWTAIAGNWSMIQTLDESPSVAEQVFDLKTVGAERYAHLYKSVFSA